MAGASGLYAWEDAERPERHAHAEHGHDRGGVYRVAGGCVTGPQPATSTRIASRRSAAFSSMARPCSR
ncbi:hypothetical protein CCL22_27040 [Pseudomonas syringae]|nr:hypothetical protein CCL22_27040 [Pseudomonas syringae]